MEERCISQRTNGSAHLYDDSSYAHFSQITDSNKYLFPSLKKTSPLEFTLHKGDCLYIPAKWWHWVRSYGTRCLSVNYWFNKPLNTEPKIHKELIKDWKALEKWTNDYLIEVSEINLSEGAWIWRDNFALKKRITIKEFINTYSSIVNKNTDKTEVKDEKNKEKEFAYLITLKDYEHDGSHSNRCLLTKLEDDITFPFIDSVDEYQWNLWMNFGGLDTGLHFDDDEGLLCVIDGMKHVTLYPPSDSKYLMPYPMKPYVLKRNNRNFMFNLYKDLGPIIPDNNEKHNCEIDSCSILELTLKKAPNLAKYTIMLQKHFGVGNIVYGIKNNDGIIKWEYYFYGIDRSSETFQDKRLLFKVPKYNKNLSLDRYLEFHNDHFKPNIKTNNIIKSINQNGLMVYSLDFDEENAMSGIISKINLYYTIVDEVKVPFILKEDTLLLSEDERDKKKEKINIQTNSIQGIDLFNLALGNIISFTFRCTKLGLEEIDIANLHRFINGSEYKAKTVSLVNKRTEIGIYFFGISYDAFLKFLITYMYPPELVSFVSSHSEDLMKQQLEVGFHFPKGSTNGLPSRTAFYGLF
jgi:hypothetical protein